LFGLNLQVGGTALDLGAAPGGWTRILRKHGVSVVAVDPAELGSHIASDLGVRHVRETAQSYLQKAGKPFDVILNDMRMDARVSARIMVMAGSHLEDSGWALLTLKLPKRGMAKTAASALELVRKGTR
jgi:23S rRNA (cytidine2498-2'-O)-methyltransferase